MSEQISIGGINGTHRGILKVIDAKQYDQAGNNIPCAVIIGEGAKQILLGDGKIEIDGTPVTSAGVDLSPLEGRVLDLETALGLAIQRIVDLEQA